MANSCFKIHTIGLLTKKSVAIFLLQSNTTTTDDKLVPTSHNCSLRFVSHQDLEKRRAGMKNDNTNERSRNRNATVLVFPDVQLTAISDHRNGLNEEGYEA